MTLFTSLQFASLQSFLSQSMPLRTWVTDFLLNSIWQVPMVFAAAWLAARLVRSSGPQVEHRVWTIALVLQTVLPMCSIDRNGLAVLWQWLSAFLAWSSEVPAHSETVRVLIGPATANSNGVLHLPTGILFAILILYAGSLVYFCGRLAWGLWRAAALRRDAQPVTVTTALADQYEHLHRLFDFKHTQIATSKLVSGPVTIGLRNPLLLLPHGFLQRINDADLEAVLAHEFAHMQRRDFAKNLLYECISLPLAYHPALWLTRSRLAETREMICDDIAANAVSGHTRYAHSLLRLAALLSERPTIKTLHAIGIFDANILERRVMNLTRKNLPLPAMRKLLVAFTCSTVALATGLSAMALRVSFSQPTAIEMQQDKPKRLNVKSDQLTILTHTQPVYPQEAKEKRIQGEVLLDAVINTKGEVELLRVKSGPKELERSALDAVRTWRYQPYLLNGDPIEVQTTITVIYTLSK